MANFGWAYIDCSSSAGASAAGPTGSVQVHSASAAHSGSENFTYDFDASILSLTGSLIVSGTIRANELDIISTTVTEVNQSGSTKFGDSDDDTHIFTGSFSVVSSSEEMLSVDPLTTQTFVKALKVNYTSIAGTSYQILNSDFIIGVQNSSNVLLTLPSASVSNTGSVMVIKDEVIGRGPTSITVSASVGETVDGDSFVELSGSLPAINVYTNGTGWFIF